jgi:hypothetical protein
VPVHRPPRCRGNRSRSALAPREKIRHGGGAEVHRADDHGDDRIGLESAAGV